MTSTPTYDDLIVPHLTYVDLTFSKRPLLFAKRRRSRIEFVNDADGKLCDSFRALREGRPLDPVQRRLLGDDDATVVASCRRLLGVQIECDSAPALIGRLDRRRTLFTADLRSTATLADEMWEMLSRAVGRALVVCEPGAAPATDLRGWRRSDVILDTAQIAVAWLRG